MMPICVKRSFLFGFLICVVSSRELINSTAKRQSQNFRSHLQQRTNCNGSDDEEFVACGTLEYLGCMGSKKLYHESAIKMGWHEAWEYCRSLGLHLATIESKYEQSFIEIFLPIADAKTPESYWTSGNDFVIEGQFSWMTTGKLMTFYNFRKGEPNNRFGSENCVELVIQPGNKDYHWNDKNCLRKGYVLCQLDLRYPEKLFDASDRNIHV